MAPITIGVLTFLCLALALALALALVKLDQTREERNSEMLDEEAALHAKCLAHVAQFVGDEFAARVLDAAAEDWESADGLAEARSIANNQYKPGGKSVPRLWLEQRAATMRGETS